MNLFNKRPLSLILCIMLSGFSLFAVFSVELRRITLIVALLSLIVAAVLYRHAICRTIIAVSLAYILSATLSFIYFDQILLKNKSYEDAVFEGVVLDCQNNSLNIDARTINGYAFNRSVRLYAPDGEIDADVGAIIKFKANFIPYELSREADRYMISSGLVGECELTDLIDFQASSPTLKGQLARLRASIASYNASIMKSEAAGLFSALIIGERSLVERSVLLDFSRIGIQHILALSGMHLAILSLLVLTLLSALGVGKNKRLIFLSLFTLFYMALAGFSPSVFRAGLMLIISNLLYLSFGMKDTVTSLFVACTVIILIEPYAALDIGLWLSMLATLGVLLFSETKFMQNASDGIMKRIGKYILSSFLISLFAILMTLVITAFVFGRISYLTSIGTLVFSALTQIYIYLGIITMLIGRLVPIGNAMNFIYDYTVVPISSSLSSMPYALSSVEFPIAMLLCAISFILILVFLLFKIKRRVLMTVILAASLIITNACAVILTAARENTPDITFYSGKTDLALLSSSGVCALIENGNPSGGSVNEAIDVLEKENICELDCYFLLGYHKSQETTTPNLLANVKTKELYLPHPKNENEEKILLKIIESTESFAPKIHLYSEGDDIKLGDFSILSVCRTPYGETSQVAAFCIEYKDKLYSYLSSGVLEESDLAWQLFVRSETVILGNAGRTYTSRFYIDYMEAPVKSIVIFGYGVNINQKYFDKGRVIYGKSCVDLI